MSRLTIEEAIEQFKDLEDFVMNETGALPNDKDMEAFEVLIEAVQELQHYKDLEEQGRLVEVAYSYWENIKPYTANGQYLKAQICGNCNAYFISNGNEPYSNHPYCCECGAKMALKGE